MIKLTNIKNFVFLLIGIIMGSIIFDIAPYDTDKYGAMADWVSGIGTLAAFFAIFWQQHRQEQIERAIRVEQNRPRFARMARGKMPEKANILTNKQPDDKLLYEFVSNPRQNIKGIRKELLTLENISKNTIYRLEIIIEYKDDTKEFWSRNGIHENGIVAMVPSFFADEKRYSDDAKERVKLKVHFLTPSYEVGFYTYDYEKNEGNYLFIRNQQNEVVKSHKHWETLDRHNDEIDKLIKEFKNCSKEYKVTFSVPYWLLRETYESKKTND